MMTSMCSPMAPKSAASSSPPPRLWAHHGFGRWPIATSRTARRRTATIRRARRQWPRSLSHGDGGEKGYNENRKRLSMSTIVLAYLILFMGFITFLCGAFGILMLLFEEVSKTERVQFRYYAMVVGLISGGLAMIGIGQGLRLLLLILGEGVIPASP